MTRQFGRVTDIVWCQFRGDNLMCAGVNPKIQFALAPRRADSAFMIHTFALTRRSSVDEEMQWLLSANRLG